MPASLVQIAKFLAAVLVTHICASVAASQLVLAELTAMAVPIPLSTRLEVTFTDMWRSAPLYWVLIIPSLLMSVLLLYGVRNRFGHLSNTLLLMFCCGTLLWLCHALTINTIGMPLIAGYRGWGSAWLFVSGTIGAYCYRLLINKRRVL